MLALSRFGELITGGKAVEIEGFPGIEVRRFLLFRSFLSFPYTLPTDTPLPERTLRLIKARYTGGEIALTYHHSAATLTFPSPVVRRGAKYHRERRRLIRRAEERCEVMEEVPFDTFYALYSETVKGYGRKPIPERRMRDVYSLEGVETVGVKVEDRVVGVLMSLALPDRYLLWQMGWEGPNFVPTYLLHLGIERGFALGYDTVDLGISPSPSSLKLKSEMGGDVDRKVYVIRWRRVV